MTSLKALHWDRDRGRGVVVNEGVPILPVLEIGLKIDCLAQWIMGPNSEVRHAAIFDIRRGIAGSHVESEGPVARSGTVCGRHGDGERAAQCTGMGDR